MNCKQCNAVIEQVGNRTKEFCSDRCRKAFGRQSGQFNPDKIQSGQADQVQSGHARIEQVGQVFTRANRQYKHGDTVTLSDGQTFVRDMTARATSSMSGQGQITAYGAFWAFSAGSMR